jgi:hypothetical protein
MTAPWTQKTTVGPESRGLRSRARPGGPRRGAGTWRRLDSARDGEATMVHVEQPLVAEDLVSTRRSRLRLASSQTALEAKGSA